MRKNKSYRRILSIWCNVVLFFYTMMTVNSMETCAKTQNTFQIVIIGSEPECITAAVVAAQLGNKVTIITEDDQLGGLFTEGMLTALDINYINKTKVLHQGFYKKFYNECGNGSNLDLKKTQNFFDKMIKDYKITVIKNAKEITPIVATQTPQKAMGVSYQLQGNTQKILGDFIFDGSTEATYSRKMGASYLTGRSEFGLPNEYAAAGVMFSLMNVNWEKMASSIKESKSKMDGMNESAAWGFSQMYQYVPQNKIFKMRGLNISKQNDKSIIINALLAYDKNILDPKEEQNLIGMAKKELSFIVKYMNKNIPGFEKATLKDVAKETYIREGVRIVGEKTLTGYDMISHSAFYDAIAYGSYPSDLQSSNPQSYGNSMNGSCVYQIPLRAMIPKGLSNVIVLGRSASFDIVAHGSARTVPVLMAMAEGAVYAVDYALTNGIPISKMEKKQMLEVQKNMKTTGKIKFWELPNNIYKGKFYEEAVKYLHSKGLLSTRYEQEFPVDEPASGGQLSLFLSLVRQHSNFSIPKISIKNKVMTLKDFTTVGAGLIDPQIKTLEEMKEKGVLSDTTYTQMTTTKKLTNGHLYVFLADCVKYMDRGNQIVVNKDPVNVVEHAGAVVEK